MDGWNGQASRSAQNCWQGELGGQFPASVEALGKCGRTDVVENVPLDMVIEGDHGTHHRMPLSAQLGLVRTKNCCTQGGETPLTKKPAFCFPGAERKNYLGRRCLRCVVWCGCQPNHRRSMRWPKSWHFIRLHWGMSWWAFTFVNVIAEACESVRQKCC